MTELEIDIYPELPFSKLIEIAPEELSQKERDFFYKTNVDYTFELVASKIKNY